MTVAEMKAADPYTSRTGATWEAVPRQDPVLWGALDGPLTQNDARDFEQEGLLAISQLIDTKLAEQLLEEARRMADVADPDALDVIAEPGSNVVRSLFRVHRANQMFRDICKDPSIAGLARQILGSEVYIHQSRINFKPAFSGKKFFWHSDFETWHVEDGMPRMRALSISINLTENHEFNGPLMLVGGSHRTYVRCVGETPDDHFKDSLRKQEYGVPSRDALQLLVESGSGITAPKGAPGSATAFDCNTMHGSVGNLSPYPRTNLFVVFNSVENALVEPFGGKPPRPEFLGEREVIPVSQL
jgi:ectoine hydroxylase